MRCPSNNKYLGFDIENEQKIKASEFAAFFPCLWLFWLQESNGKQEVGRQFMDSARQ